jgi:methylglyoxal synthase
MKTDQHTIAMKSRKCIALVAHDNKKRDLLEWARFNRETLEQHDLYATGTTGSLLADALSHDHTVAERAPGRGSADRRQIAEREIDFAIFFWIARGSH